MLQQTPEYKRLPLHRIHGRRLSTKDFDFSAPSTAFSTSAAFTRTEPNASLCDASLANSTVCGDMYYAGPKNEHRRYGTKPVELATTLWPPHKTNYWFPNWKELFHGFVVMQKDQSKEARVADSEQKEDILYIEQQRSGSSPQCSSTQSLQQGSNSAIRSVYALPSQAPSAGTKSNLKSPLWLPQGWITESHTRRTGTTAGTTDKYFKHLVSGRRFRTRKDVLHFISTGKCRTRKKNTGKKVLMLPTRHPFMKAFAHKKLRIPEGWKPFSESCFEDQYSTYVASSLLQRQQEPRLDNSFEPQFKQSSSLHSSSSIQPSGKASTKERIPVKKKAKTLPSKCGEDKQASKLWQWLTKTVAKDSDTPSNKEMFTLSFSSPSLEKKVIEMTNTRNKSLRDQPAQRPDQLSKEIQAAHNNMVQMSKEMQATAEKLSRQIFVAQKDVEFRNETQVSVVPTASCLPLAGTSEAGTNCRSHFDTQSNTYSTTAVVEQTPLIVANHLTEKTKFPNVTSCITIGMVPRLGSTTSSLKELPISLQAKTQLLEACSYPLLVREPTKFSSNIMMLPEVQMVTLAPAALRIEAQEATRHGVAIEHVLQHTDVCTHAKVECTRHALWPEAQMEHAYNLFQTTCKLSSSTSERADRCASKCCAMLQPVNKIKDGSHTTTTNVLVTNNHLEQAKEAAEAKDVQAARRQTPSKVHMPQVPVLTKRKATPVHDMYTDTTAKGKAAAAGEVVTLVPEIQLGSACRKPFNDTYMDTTAKGKAVAAGDPGTLIHGTQLTIACSGREIQEADRLESVRRQQIEEIVARHLRKKKFSAVLNPRLDLSRLSPSLTSRQRAKAVERMKARHARELLATLGKHLCRKAVRRKQPWSSAAS